MSGLSLGLGLGLASRSKGVAIADFRNGMPAGSTYTRPGEGAGLTSGSLVVFYAANEPQRTDRGLCLEPARTSLVLRASEFDNAAWVKSNAGNGVLPVVTANAAVAPDGTTTADQIVLNRGATDVSGDQSFLTQASIPTATSSVYQGTVWVRSSTPCTLLTRNVGGAGYGLLSVTSTWTRFTRQETAAGTSSDFSLGLRGGFGSSQTATVEAWVAGLELGTGLTSPIRTTTAAATRGLPVFTETVPSGRTKALLTYADATTTLVTGLTPGGTFDYVTPILAANKGRFGVSELVTREWQA